MGKKNAEAKKKNDPRGAEGQESYTSEKQHAARSFPINGVAADRENRFSGENLERRYDKRDDQV